MTADLHRIRARDVMHSEISWAEPDETLREAAVRMQQDQVRALLVRSPGGGLPGIVTTKDIVNLLGSQPPTALDQVLVGDVASRPAMCVPAHANLVDCINLMRMAGVRRMPVLDGQQVVGILSSSDVFSRVLRG